MLLYSDMFLYLIMLNLLKESYALHAIQITVNDYLCCNGVECLGRSFTHSSLTNDTCDLSDYA